MQLSIYNCCHPEQSEGSLSFKKGFFALLRMTAKVITPFSIILYFIFFFTPATVQAASVSVSPVIMDKKASARDILKDSLTIFNNTNNRLSVYTFVNNIAAAEGEQKFLDPAKADMASSFANWISISRGVIDLAPKEKRKIDFSVEVNLRARPGMYHAQLAFADGATRAEAEKKMETAPTVAVNLEVLEDIKERLQLKKFIPAQMVFSGFPASFFFTLENTGNRTLTPSGEIIIYDYKGEETASLPINQDGVSLEPGAEIVFANTWKGEGQFKEFGRYKAVLRAEYGAAGARSAQDVVFFWIIPWRKILPIFLLLAGLTATIILIKFKRRKNCHSRESGNPVGD